MSALWPTICTFPTQIDDVFMQKVSKPTHYYLSGIPLFLGASPDSPDPETLARLTNPSHLNSNTGCTSAKILWLWTNSLELSSAKTASCGFFQIGLRNSEVIVETLSPIIWPNQLLLDSGWAADVETGPNGWFSEKRLHTKVLKGGARMEYGNPARWDFNSLQNPMTRFV
jgi:hypothetical protein